MDKKFEDQLAKMAFGELDEAQSNRVRKQAASDADAAKALAAYEAIKSDLRRMRDIPPDQLSKERLQNAILTGGLKPKPVRRAFPWAWASSVAVLGAFALAVFIRLPQVATPVADNFPQPSFGDFPILGPGDNQLIDQTIGGFYDVQSPTQPVSTAVAPAAKPTTETADESAQPVAIYTTRPRAWHYRSYKSEPYRGESRSPVDQSPTLQNALVKAALKPAKKAPETLVLIQSDKDNNTGASDAVEVQQTEDVIVSS